LRQFKNSIQLPSWLIEVFEDDGKLSNRKFYLELEEPFSVDYRLILSRLKTGYPVYDKLRKYKKQDNGLSDRILAI